MHNIFITANSQIMRQMSLQMTSSLRTVTSIELFVPLYSRLRVVDAILTFGRKSQKN